MTKNLLIGAISGNYTVEDVKPWVLSAKRVLTEEDSIVVLCYNMAENNNLIEYLKNNDIEVIAPDFDLWGHDIQTFETNTGTTNQTNSFRLVHNIRFLHIWYYLTQNEFDNVLITDVKDVIINKRPFDSSANGMIIASSEEILYKDHAWNREHMESSFGLASQDILDCPVYNVGVLYGGGSIVKQLCMDIYLNAMTKHKVADQTSYNYLIQKAYKRKTIFTDLSDRWAVHLHVINEGRVAFDLNTIKEFTIIHQYDRLGNEILNYYTIPQ